jgi:hypothetical protein
MTADESNRQPLRRGQSDATDHPLRHALQLVIDRPHPTDEFEYGIRIHPS